MNRALHVVLRLPMTLCDGHYFITLYYFIVIQVTFAKS